MPLTATTFWNVTPLARVALCVPQLFFGLAALFARGVFLTLSFLQLFLVMRCVWSPNFVFQQSETALRSSVFLGPFFC